MDGGAGSLDAKAFADTGNVKRMRESDKISVKTFFIFNLLIYIDSYLTVC